MVWLKVEVLANASFDIQNLQEFKFIFIYLQSLTDLTLNFKRRSSSLALPEEE